MKKEVNDKLLISYNHYLRKIYKTLNKFVMKNKKIIELKSNNVIEIFTLFKFITAIDNEEYFLMYYYSKEKEHFDLMTFVIVKNFEDCKSHECLDFLKKSVHILEDEYGFVSNNDVEVKMKMVKRIISDPELKCIKEHNKVVEDIFEFVRGTTRLGILDGFLIYLLILGDTP